ncbi:hypothetical protein [Pedobacter sp. MC2016-24]|uniref:hypothetical protein n=1 Tax=Pedobacter sp. MC2016-24 TaxID=2780090 RepID=UPI0018818369|nr:hypothetical protein [Pedobacter sp. MC2016-24]MBE9603206.1 hypothetical protein [Pedobacter sp. MC2016-24]
MTKRISTLILFCLCCYSALAQVKIKIERATITLPKQAKQLTKKERNETLDKKFKLDELIANADAENNYDVDGMLLVFKGVNVNKNHNYLKETELVKNNRRKRLHMDDNYYYISISTVNKNQVLINRNLTKDYCYYDFVIVNDDFTYSVRGSLTYLQGEETKSRAIIDQILDNTTIK